MQQTDKYKLNLVEKDDVFSPEALNENMEKVEGAIIAGDAALSQRLQVFEAHRMVFGTFVGSGSTSSSNYVDVYLGFTPKMVIIPRGGLNYILLEGDRTNRDTVRFIDGGFQVRNEPGVIMIGQGVQYTYFAFA